MQGWNILVHSVRLVFRNLDAAFRISLVPYLMSGIAMVAFALPTLQAIGDGSPERMMAVETGQWVNFMIYAVIYGIAALWIAVAWHRYVLLEELPAGWIPPLHGAQMIGYFLKGLVIGLCLVLTTIIVGLILGLLIGWAGPLGAMIVGLGTTAVATIVFYRLCPILPSAALGHSMSIGDAMQATKDATQTILVLTVLVLVASFVIQLPATLGAPQSTFTLAYSFVINWVSMLVGVSVLTTFYGHYVEGREID